MIRVHLRLIGNSSGLHASPNARCNWRQFSNPCIPSAPPDKPQTALAFEVRIVRAHIDDSILLDGAENHIDPDKWRPLIMSFCHFYGLGERIWHSNLAEIPEEAYRPVPHMAR